MGFTDSDCKVPVVHYLWERCLQVSVQSLGGQPVSRDVVPRHYVNGQLPERLSYSALA